MNDDIWSPTAIEQLRLAFAIHRERWPELSDEAFYEQVIVPVSARVATAVLSNMLSRLTPATAAEVVAAFGIPK